MEFSELFVFASFGNVRLSKFRIFLEKTGIFRTHKVFAKMFGKKYGSLSSEKSLEKFGKVWKSSENFGKVWK